MKISKTLALILAILFFVGFIYSLFDAGQTHNLLFWEVNIWGYRAFRLLIAVSFLKMYLDKRKSVIDN
jgi:hypothetical protein